MKQTLKNRISEAKALLKRTYETVIIYEVVCSLSDEAAIEPCLTLQAARDCIKGINEECIRSTGSGIRLFIRPVVVDDDSFEPVTEKNMQYYDLNSEWVKEYKADMEQFRGNLKQGIIS